ncbi:histidine kinase dimerization/phosphoacceptor domain -containing protein [Brevundimonas sp.]|uniref:sensor histidine kinase n=1 Tax=Brevundimonas sp. TaxID=1871086 RepID=UPI0025E90C17|nr:histidine kinase dimerization/phosphoacceptor domain -containing protein [Brevundimonas sp.]
MSLRVLLTRAEQRGFGPRVLALLAVGFLLLIAINGVSIWSSSLLDSQLQRVEHTRNVRATIGAMETSLARNEAEHRAFLLTGEDGHARAAEDAGARAGESFIQLRELVAEDPDQVRRLDAISPLLAEQLALSEQIVRNARSGQAYAALMVVRSGRGADLAARIGHRLQEVDAFELDQLRDQAGTVENASRASLYFATFGTGLVVLIGGASVWLIWRYLAALHQAQDRLARANEELEARVEARTADLSQARDRAEAMLREVNHRVGNSLQLVSSFISLQSRRLDDPEAKEALRATQARIEAVSQVHRRLYTSAEVGEVALDDYLTALAEELRQSLCAEPGAPTIEVEAQPVVTNTDKAVAVGVLVAELVTNAVKYAYPKGQGGEIRVRLDEIANEARLVVEDDGVGLSGGPPKGTGLGGAIVAAMAKDLKTKIEYQSGEPGVRALVRFAA